MRCVEEELQAVLRRNRLSSWTGAGRPQRCTPMIPDVFGVIIFRTDSGSMLCVSSSMSANTGVNPCQ